MKKFKEMTKKKKIITIVIVVVVVIALVVTAVLVVKKKNTNNTENITYTRTVTLSYGALSETIVASGTIESQNTTTVTASSNATVSKINYKVGDYVDEGDVIIELDKSDINKQITKQQESVSDSEEQLQENYDKSVSSKDDVYSEWYAAQSTYSSAYAAYKKAYDEISGCQTKYNTAAANYDSEVQKLIKDGYTIKDGKCYSGTTDVSETVDGKKFKEYKDALETATANLNTIKSSSDYENLKKTYETAKTNYETLTNQLKSANAKVAEASDALDEGVNDDNLNDLYDELEDYELCARSSGQITSLDAVVGNMANGTLATIADTSKLKISVTIDEYDIFDVALGQKATIETDASDEVYEGVVSQIAPTATGSMGSSGFEVEIDVTSEDVSKLLIGMSAEVTITVSDLGDNFSVPIDAVETKEDGTKVIYVENDDGDFDEVVVTTGDDNGYYIEIFGDDLKEGMKVRASANAKEAEVTTDTSEFPSDMGDFSMPSGDMPSGGGNMPGGNGGGMPSGGFNGN